MIYAKDCKCIECGKQAVAFWPCIDPDVPSHPYCQKCLDKARMRVLKDIRCMDREKPWNKLRDVEC